MNPSQTPHSNKVPDSDTFTPAKLSRCKDNTRDVQKSRAKSKLKRKKKLLVWTDDLHLQFASAVFELGVKNASPKALLALMETKSPMEGLTIEQIKSHLEKYRINYERSRLEVQRYNKSQKKRSLKRYHLRTLHRRPKDPSNVAKDARSEVNESIAGTFDDQWTSDRVPIATLSPDTDQQLNMCDTLLLEDEHNTMHQRMDFHRELLLTRSVEVASGLSWANRMDSIDCTGVLTSRVIDDSNACYESPATDSSFLQAWANAEQLGQQEEQVYGRLHQHQQSLFEQQQSLSLMQDATPIVHCSVNSGSQPEPPSTAADESKSGIDLSSWGRLSLTVDSDDDDIFGFLQS